jgi:predicted O-methyltransferase YrrM
VPDTYFASSQYAHIHPELESLLAGLPEAPEGHISPEQGEYLFHFIRLVRPAFVAETGFCVGHSACIIMLAQESLGLAPSLLSIDICRYEETKRSADLVKKRFAGLKFVEGDTRDVLASALRRYLRRHGELPLDLGLIDGGHDAQTALSDLEIFLSCLRPGGYIWLDDFEKSLPNSGVNLAGHTFARRWGNCHRFETRDGRGFMLHQKRT